MPGCLLGALGSGVARTTEVSYVKDGGWGMYTPSCVCYWLRAAPAAWLPPPLPLLLVDRPLRWGHRQGQCQVPAARSPRPGAESPQGCCDLGAKRGAADRGIGPCSCGRHSRREAFP